MGWFSPHRKKPRTGDIPVLTVSYNAPELVREVLTSFRRFYGNPFFLIDGSDPGPLAEIKEIAGSFKDVTLIPFGYNIHHGPGMAWAMDHLPLAGPVLFLDSDVSILRAGFLEALAEALKPGMFGVGNVSSVNEGGHNVPDGPGTIPYLHPACMLCNIEEMKRWPRPVLHGAPLIQTMLALHQANRPELLGNVPWVGNDFGKNNERIFLAHDWQGTVLRTGGYHLEPPVPKPEPDAPPVDAKLPVRPPAVGRQPKRIVQSFDVFDTLLARSVGNPTDVFDRVEAAGIPQFKARRLEAQARATQALADIYRHYQLLTGIDDAERERIQALELQAEQDVAYLISETCHRVQDGDILVSDMYLPAERIAELLRSAGFAKDVALFATPDGKATGAIWPMLQANYLIANHTGDNVHSDVEVPGTFGIPTTHCAVASPSPLEGLLLELGAVTTAALLKRFRLTNPHRPASREWRRHDLQARGNLPFLLLMAAHLRTFLAKEGLGRILFSTRDSCLLQPLFQFLHPDVDSVTFHTSRIAYLERRPSYKNYLRAVYRPGSTLIFDLHGAFKTGRDLFPELFGTQARVHLFSFAKGRAPLAEGLTFDVLDGTNHAEKLNLDTVGPLVTVLDDGTALRAPVSDYDPELGAFYQSTLQAFLALADGAQAQVREELSQAGARVPWVDIHNYLGNLVAADPELAPIPNSEHASLAMWAEQSPAVPGASAPGLRAFARIYESLLHPYGASTAFSILVLGAEATATLRILRQYFGARVALYAQEGGAGAPEGAMLIPGAGTPAEAFAQCAAARPEGFDVIIQGSQDPDPGTGPLALKALWGALRPGGSFVLEALEGGTGELLQAWASGDPAGSRALTPQEATTLLRDVADLRFFEAQGPCWPQGSFAHTLAVVRKRQACPA